MSDERYAHERARSRVAQGVGPLRIAQELKEKGVAPETVAAALQAQGDNWAERALAVRVKRFGTEAPGDRLERARQARFLQSRGFRYEDIAFAIDTRTT